MKTELVQSVDGSPDFNLRFLANHDLRLVRSFCHKPKLRARSAKSIHGQLTVNHDDHDVTACRFKGLINDQQIARLDY